MKEKYQQLIINLLTKFQNREWSYSDILGRADDKFEVEFFIIALKSLIDTNKLIYVESEVDGCPVLKLNS